MRTVLSFMHIHLMDLKQDKILYQIDKYNVYFLLYHFKPWCIWYVFQYHRSLHTHMDWLSVSKLHNFVSDFHLD